MGLRLSSGGILNADRTAAGWAVYRDNRFDSWCVPPKVAGRGEREPAPDFLEQLPAHGGAGACPNANGFTGGHLLEDSGTNGSDQNTERSSMRRHVGRRPALEPNAPPLIGRFQQPSSTVWQQALPVADALPEGVAIPA
jgi:hypothetical protein